MKRVVLCALAALVGVLVAGAQTIKVPESWDKLAAKANEVVNVNLDKKMLRLGSSFMNDEGDEEGKQMISKLNGIYVRSLEFKSPGEFTDADVEPIRAQLQGPEWVHMVDITDKSAKENVTVYLRMVNDQAVGMVVLVQEPTELTFVNLDGPINPEDLKHLSGNFGIPPGVGGAPRGKVGPDKPKQSTEVKK